MIKRVYIIKEKLTGYPVTAKRNFRYAAQLRRDMIISVGFNLWNIVPMLYKVIRYRGKHYVNYEIMNRPTIYKDGVEFWRINEEEL